MKKLERKSFSVRTVLLLALVAFCAGLAFGQSKEFTFDGNDWTVPTAHEKLMFAGGFLRGYGMAVADAVNRRTVLEFPKTMSIDQLVDTVGTFYGDYRNVSICWDHAARFAVLALAGEPAADEELRAVRTSDARAGCVPE